MAEIGYTCTYFANEVTPLTVNYYDNYDFLEVWPGTITNDLIYQAKSGYGAAYAAYPLFGNQAGCKGLLTGSITRILGTDNFLYRIDYYDERERVVQTRATNHLSGYDMTYNQYGFTGNLIQTLTEHSAAGQPAITELYQYAYDHAMRPTVTTYSPNGHSTVLTSNTYDELGRLITKQRHNTADTEQFEYNIRNWTTKIQSGTFEENLYYNNPPVYAASSTPCFNGNISLATWKYNGAINGYQYFYDGLNRLSSTYSILNNQWADYYFSESFSYDKHGNIKSLNRWDNQDITDYLNLTYNGNQLKKVTDNGTSQHSYNIKEYQDLSNQPTEFFYDKNGNTITDLDREIVTIKYNLLNLPDTVQFMNGNQIINKYSADGRKLQTDYVTAQLPLVMPIGNVANSTGYGFVRYGTIYAGNIEYRFGNMGYLNLARIHNPRSA
jgi:hypothetical protein